MTKTEGLLAAGQQPASAHRIALVNAFKEMEERLLRELDAMADTAKHPRFDPRWLATARTHFEQGFMALNRSVLRPVRIRLPGDECPETRPIGAAQAAIAAMHAGEM